MGNEETYTVKGKSYCFSVTAVNGIITRGPEVPKDSALESDLVKASLEAKLVGQPVKALEKWPGVESVTLVELPGRERE